jgi:hypothetical protein
MEGFTLYLGILFVISFVNILLALFLLLKAIQLKVHFLIVLICAVVATGILVNTDLYPFRTITNALIILVVLAILFACWLFNKYKAKK